jgi:hypothetical protein
MYDYSVCRNFNVSIHNFMLLLTLEHLCIMALTIMTFGMMKFSITTKNMMHSIKTLSIISIMTLSRMMKNIMLSIFNAEYHGFNFVMLSAIINSNIVQGVVVLNVVMLNVVAPFTPSSTLVSVWLYQRDYMPALKQ